MDTILVVEDDQESQQILSLVRRANGISSQKSQSGFGSLSSNDGNHYNPNLLSGDSNARFSSLTANGGGSNMESAVRCYYCCLDILLFYCCNNRFFCKVHFLNLCYFVFEQMYIYMHFNYIYFQLKRLEIYLPVLLAVHKTLAVVLTQLIIILLRCQPLQIAKVVLSQHSEEVILK